MSLTAFHKHFKQMTSLTPGQYQKRLRLIEARRLMLEDDYAASNSAFEVGYESVSQFTREYRRLFEAPPKRDAKRARRGSRSSSSGSASSRPWVVLHRAGSEIIPGLTTLPAHGYTPGMVSFLVPSGSMGRNGRIGFTGPNRRMLARVLLAHRSVVRIAADSQSGSRSQSRLAGPNCAAHATFDLTQSR